MVFPDLKNSFHLLCCPRFLPALAPFFQYRGNVTPARDYSDWQTLISRLIQHENMDPIIGNNI
jgi:hypothetical protein